LTLDSVKTVFEIGAIVLGAVVVLFVYLSFHPNMALQLQTEWADSNKSVLLIKIEIKNISRVKCEKERVLLQILEYSNDYNTHLSEWVPFDKNSIPPNEQPIEFNEPVSILESTEFWYPGDGVRVERSFKCKPDRTYKIGLQLLANISFLGRVSKFFRKRNWKNQEQWTTTKIIYRDTNGR
jgi:hypothetical protein